MSYDRPYRPRPVALANRLGRALGRVGVAMAALDVDALVAAARRTTGLSDFGDDAFLEPLRLLVDSIEAEAELTPVGRYITRTRLVGILSNRLRVEDAFARHPDILDQPIEAPVIIAGLQRTGTTMLHRLLAVDPGLRSLASWEALNPAPLPASRWRRGDPRLRAARLGERGLAYLSPEFFAVHPVEAEAPEEEVILLDYSFLSSVAEATLHVPTFAAWLEQQDQTPAYRYMRKLLQYLQWQRSGDRWLLKTPHHMEWLDTLLAVFPDARIIQTHRDPLKTLASFCSMVAHGRGVMSDAVDPLEVGRHWSNKVIRQINRAMAARDRAPASTFIDVSYYDLIDDPMAQIRRIYDFIGRELTPATLEAMEASRRVNVKNKYGAHTYDLASFGLTREALEPRVAGYRARHGIRHEA